MKLFNLALFSVLIGLGLSAQATPVIDSSISTQEECAEKGGDWDLEARECTIYIVTDPDDGHTDEEFRAAPVSFANSGTRETMFEADCKFADWQLINDGLKSRAVAGDQRLVNALLGVLLLERGPTCKALFSTTPMATPSIYEYRNYVVRHLNAQYFIDFTINKINKSLVRVEVR